LEVKKDRTVEYELYQLGDCVSLTLAPATEANKRFFNAMLRAGQKTFKKIRHGGVSSKTVSENRALAKKLFPEHVIKGWTGIVDTNCEPVAFTVQNCEDFLEQLPDWIFDEIKEFASDVANFVEAPESVEELAKN
jgi:hypothetical protein